MVRGVTHILDASSSQAHEFVTIDKTRHQFEVSFYNFKEGVDVPEFLDEKKRKVLTETLFYKYEHLLQSEVTMKFRKKLLKHMFQDEVEGEFVPEEITLEELYEYCIEMYGRILMDGYIPPASTDGIEIITP
jgi:hypothetical protein